ncbi:MAG: GNAT family N-acyltransferase [Gallionellaceae bacterium]|jgi:putative hemolysin
MLNLIQQQAQKTQSKLIVGLAKTGSDVEDAQRIRYKVFGEEMGAKLPSAESGLDVDRYDRYCDHLLARNLGTNEVIGTYRILPPEQAIKAGGYYSETEFDISRLSSLRDSMVEVGRSCVHSDYRDGATITQLWGGLADYIATNSHEFIIGCASISMTDGGHYAASVYNKIYKLHAAPEELSVKPLRALPLDTLNQNLEVIIPPLIKGYLRLGAYIGGAPAWDPEFNCADLFILLPVARMNERYAKHFMRKTAQA